MLEIEGALLLLLQRRVRPLRGEVAPDWAPEHSLSIGLTRDILVGRQAAARGSLTELQATADALGFRLPSVEYPWIRDLRRAQAAAEGFIRGLQRHLDLVGGVEDIGADAAGWTQNRVELTAATEVSESWSSSRDWVIRQTAAQTPGVAQQLYKVWDATLDKRTCLVCERAHGTIVRIDEDFPDGMPGGVHPKCRCQEHLLTVVELARAA